MNARRLLEWGDLEARRRRAARGGLAAVPPPAWALAGGALLAAEVARRLAGADPVLAVRDASGFWVGVTCVVHVIAVFAAPFRMWWRPDAAFLARLALDGACLVGVGAARSRRVALGIASACALGALPLGLLGSWALWARHAVLLAAGFAAVGWLGPAAAVFGGATVASDRAQAAVASLAGEVAPPKTTYLGLFPSLAATGLFVGFLAAARYAATGVGPALGHGLAIPGAVIALSAVSHLAARRLAPDVGSAAAREVAALDYERLAHVERTGPSRIERLAASLCGRGGLVVDKDARLLRRRYPAPYFVLPLLVVGLWIVAATGPDRSPTWTLFLLGSAAAYNVVVARRAGRPPIEHPRLLATLALSDADVRRGKLAIVVARLLASVVLGGVPLVFASREPLAMALLVGGVTGATFVAGVFASRPRSAPT